MSYKWYHVPILALAVVVEFLQDFAKGNFEMDGRDFVKFLYCLAIVVISIGVVLVLLWLLVEWLMVLRGWPE